MPRDGFEMVKKRTGHNAHSRGAQQASGYTQGNAF